MPGSKRTNRGWSIYPDRAAQAKAREAMALERQTRVKWAKLINEQRDRDHQSQLVGAALRKAARDAGGSSRRMIHIQVRRLAWQRDSGRRCPRIEAMTGLSARKPSRVGADGRSSFHFKWVSRGVGGRRSNGGHAYRPGEAVRHLRYILRLDAREIAPDGIVSNISDDLAEVAGVMEAVEQLAYDDRANSIVYVSIVIALPHELNDSQRTRCLSNICSRFEDEQLPFIGVLHEPDARGDDRNDHAHLMVSLRPFKRDAEGKFSFAAGQASDLNDKAWIWPMRCHIADCLNRAMIEAGETRQFTPLSNEARGLPKVEGRGKDTPGQKHRERRAEDIAAMRVEQQHRAERQKALERIRHHATTIVALPVGEIAVRFAAARTAVVERLARRQADLRVAGERRQRLVADLTRRVLAFKLVQKAPIDVPGASTATTAHQSVILPGGGDQRRSSPRTPNLSDAAQVAHSAHEHRRLNQMLPDLLGSSAARTPTPTSSNGLPTEFEPAAADASLTRQSAETQTNTSELHGTARTPEVQQNAAPSPEPADQPRGDGLESGDQPSVASPQPLRETSDAERSIERSLPSDPAKLPDRDDDDTAKRAAAERDKAQAAAVFDRWPILPFDVTGRHGKDVRKRSRRLLFSEEDLARDPEIAFAMRTVGATDMKPYLLQRWEQFLAAVREDATAGIIDARGGLGVPQTDRGPYYRGSLRRMIDHPDVREVIAGFLDTQFRNTDPVRQSARIEAIKPALAVARDQIHQLLLADERRSLSTALDRLVDLVEQRAFEPRWGDGLRIRATDSAVGDEVAVLASKPIVRRCLENMATSLADPSGADTTWVIDRLSPTIDEGPIGWRSGKGKGLGD